VFQSVGEEGGAWYRNKKAQKLLAMAGMVILMFLLELIGGHISGSLALVSDAFHMLSDGASLIIAIMALHFSQKKSDSSLSYGWQRAEIVGGLINAVILFTVCLFIIIEAFGRLLDPPTIAEPGWVIGIGCVSLVFNLAGMFMFHDHGGGHGHSHGGQDTTEYTALTNEEGSQHHEDMNIRAIFLHIMGDALASAAVIISGLIVQFTTWEFKYHIDPLVSMAISVFIIYATIPLMKNASLILLQATPPGYDHDIVLQQIRSVSGVESCHHLHLWQLYKSITVATVHIQIADPADLNAITQRVRLVFHRQGIHSVTIQTEAASSDSRCRLECGIECKSGLCCPPVHAANHGSV